MGDTPGAPAPVETPPATPDKQTPSPAAGEGFSWKSNLAPDFANSPTMQKYADTKDGFNDAVRAHLDLQKMMGHEKVPVPKTVDDPAWSVFKQAFKIPEKPDGYGLPDVNVPESLKGVAFDKSAFAQVVHKHNLTPEQAKGLWAAYTEMTQQSYTKAVQGQKDALAQVINQLRTDWGDAYDSKVELAQRVINKFSGDDKTLNDWLTATLTKDPRGAKFLAEIGEQFAENKIGDFKYERHSLTAEEAEKELREIRNNPGHPYNNDRAMQRERDAAIDHVNSLHAVIAKSKTR